jgi:hypothetical protein
VTWFWHAILIALVIVPVSVLWFSCVLDIFIRANLGPLARVGWLLTILVLPVVGSLLYLIARPRAIGPTDGFGDRRTPMSQQLSDLDRLYRSGVIDEHEFVQAKRDAFAGVPAPRGTNKGAVRERATSRASE